MIRFPTRERIFVAAGPGLVAACALLASSVLVAAPEKAAGESDVPVRLALPEARRVEPMEDWYGVYAAGTKIGFLRSGLKPSREEGQPRLAFELEAEMKVRALGIQVEVQMREMLIFDGEPPYALRRGESEVRQGPFGRQVALRRQGGRFVADITEGGSSRSMELDGLDVTAEDLLTPEVWFRASRQRGDRLVARSFSVLELKSSVDTYEIDAVHESMADGVPVTFYDVRESSSILGDVGTFRYDAQGRMLSGFLGPNLEIRLETREQAHDADYEADLFVMGMAKVDAPLGDPRTVTSLVLRVDSERADRLPDGPRQSVVRDEDGTVHLRLGQRWGKGRPAPDTEKNENLQETLDYPTRRPEIEALVEKAIGGIAVPREQVQALVTFVNDFIEDSYSAQPLTVMDILRVRRGDCTEHARLFTTLARSAGIPAREVAGLVYMGDEQRAFGGHAWSEVLLDGRWVPVDPLWGEMEINATHISFSPASGKDAGFLTVLSHFAFEVESIERREEPAGSP